MKEVSNEKEKDGAEAAKKVEPTQAEPQSVYKWLDWLEKQLPFPVHRVTAGSLENHLTTPYYSEKNQKLTVAGLPAFVRNDDSAQGLMSRQCTTDFKVAPIDKKLTALMRHHGTKVCIKWIGISLDEIIRMKPGKRNTVAHRWPLIEKRVRRHDCLLWMKKRGYPEPPRSACIFCPYHNNSEWRSLPKAEFLEAAEFERKLQSAHAKTGMGGIPFLHRSMVPLTQVDLRTDEDRGQQVMFGNECEGMCGV